jgi:hypothetical protein
LTEYDVAIKNVYWNGSELRRISYHEMVRDMVNFGFHGYAGDLAHEIDKVRIAEEVSSLFLYGVYFCILCIVY